MNRNDALTSRRPKPTRRPTATATRKPTHAVPPAKGDVTIHRILSTGEVIKIMY